jgi:hypothetical protein
MSIAPEAAREFTGSGRGSHAVVRVLEESGRRGSFRIDCRSGRNAALISTEKSSGYSQATKWPPLLTLL